MILTVADIDKTDPKKLAEALRRECNKAINCDAFMDPPGVVPRFATALLAVLDECERWHTSTTPMSEWRLAVDDAIRVAAIAWLKAGGVLEVEGQ